MNYAVRVENLSKSYRIRHQGAGWAKYRTLREDLLRLARAPVDWFTRHADTTEEFWALRDVSFDVQPGEVLGIIGRNGAGKSTLLKILSQITEPTSGRIRLKGRVGSLLEVGTGFHPELSGRENIYLSGAVLGMTRSEVARKFDEIVAFAEVEKFLDTPVKRYSSGMYMRLAFAVAAHLEPEILVIDEVLAVGDAAFQQKCLTRMGVVAEQGKTILFVSHNLSAIERLCDRVVLLDGGKRREYGLPQKVIDTYLTHVRTDSTIWKRLGAFPGQTHFREVRLKLSDGSECTQPTSADRLAVQIDFAVTEPIQSLILAIGVKGSEGNWLFATTPLDVGHKMPSLPGSYRTRVSFPEAFFGPKRFAITFGLYDAYQIYERLDDALVFDVLETASFVSLLPSGRVGELQVNCEWEPVTRTAEFLDSNSIGSDFAKDSA